MSVLEKFTRLLPEERELAMGNARAAFVVYGAAQDAEAEAVARFGRTGARRIVMGRRAGGDWIQEDGPADAFRHAYWNALMVRRLCDRGLAEQFATLHEAHDFSALPPKRRAIAERKRAMDLKNNRVGRGMAWAAGSEREVADKIEAAVWNRELVWYGHGK
jgi:hypothetical protein